MTAQAAAGSFAGSAGLSQMRVCKEDAELQAGDAELPKGAYDINRQQMDLRAVHSWLLPLEKVQVPEVRTCGGGATSLPQISASRSAAHGTG